jgi:uncharacterized protein YbaR (Trm112 family)
MEGRIVIIMCDALAAMRRKLLDILACPIDKHYPLRLLEFSTKEPDVVVDGALLCEACDRFYPIVDEIPVMLPDDLRSTKEDTEFLTKWKDRLPKETLASGKPVNLS